MGCAGFVRPNFIVPWKKSRVAYLELCVQDVGNLWEVVNAVKIVIEVANEKCAGNGKDMSDETQIVLDDEDEVPTHYRQLVVDLWASPGKTSLARERAKTTAFWFKRVVHCFSEGGFDVSVEKDKFEVDYNNREIYDDDQVVGKITPIGRWLDRDSIEGITGTKLPETWTQAKKELQDAKAARE